MKNFDNFSLRRNFDWVLLIVTTLLICFGLVVQKSLNLDIGTGSISTFNKQIIFTGVGLTLFFLLTFLDYRIIKKYVFFLYALAIVLLFLVLISGKSIRGTKGWLLGFQVAEFAKIVLILALAEYFSKLKTPALSFKSILVSGFIIFLPVLLIILQPDLGTDLIFVALWLFLILLIDHQGINFIKILLVIVLLAISSWIFLLKDYQKDRLLTFVNPQRDPFGSGYQLKQSVVAVGSGQFLGRGFGLGPQSQLRFLPEAKTDFVFSVIAEEFGFLGAFLVLALYLVLFLRLIKIIRSSYDDFSLFFVFGLTIVLFIQVMVNISMNLGIAPITGIPLSFLSYGGSSLVTNLVALGIVESIAVHQVRV